MRIKFLHKLSFFLLVFALLASNLHAIKYNHRPYNSRYDDQLVHFGFAIGVNGMDFAIKKQTMGLLGDSLLGIEHRMQAGFSVGVISNLKLNRYMDLRLVPTFTLGQRDITYITNLNSVQKRDTKTVESIFVEIPLELKWKAKRIVNSRPFILGGAKYTADLASLTKKRKGTEIDEYEIKLKKHDVGFTLGAGWEFYLPYNNKIALELKLFFGMIDLLVREDNIYTNRIDKITSRLFQFNITFE